MAKKSFFAQQILWNNYACFGWHASHYSSIEILEFADMNNIIQMCILSYTAYYLQLLDRPIFKSLKHDFKNVV